MSITTSARRSCSRALAALAVALAAAPARADVLHVPKDFDTIQAAVDASAAGDEIVIAAGTYAESIVLDGKFDLELRGQGKAVLGGGTVATPALSISSCSAVTVDHLRIADAQGLGVFLGQSSDVTLSRLTITDPASSGIVAGESSLVLLDRCRVERSGSDGIFVTLAAEITLSRCTVIDAAGSGISIGDLSHTVVDRCRVTGAGATGIALGLTDPATACVASRNVVLGAGTNGYFVRGPDNVLTENRAQGSVGFGLLIAGGSMGGIVQDNRLVAALNGLQSDGSGLLIRENRIVGAVQQGLICRQDGCVVADNRVVKASFDAYQIDSSVEGGSFLDNRAVAPGEDGFDVGCDGLLFAGNSCVGAGGHGFAVTGSANVLAGNSAHGSGGQDLLDSGTGNILLDNDFDVLDPP